VVLVIDGYPQGLSRTVTGRQDRADRHPPYAITGTCRGGQVPVRGARVALYGDIP